MKTLRLLLMSLVGAIAGCGTSSSTPLVDVYGSVTLDGEPVAFAEVLFIPVDPNAGSESKGTTDDAGNYTLLFPGNHRGAIPGEHRVAIRAYAFRGDVDPRSEDLDEADERSMGLQMLSGHQDLEQILPPEFSDLESSVLRADVVPGNRRIDFDLQSKK